MYNALTLTQSSYNGNSYFKNVQITIISYIIVNLLMGFYGFHLQIWLLLQIKVETKQNNSDTQFLSCSILCNGGGGGGGSSSSSS